MHLVNKMPHVSHELYKYRELICCSNCGVIGIDRFVLLDKPCEPPRTVGQRVLKSTSKGRLPPVLEQSDGLTFEERLCQHEPITFRKDRAQHQMLLNFSNAGEGGVNPCVVASFLLCYGMGQAGCTC